MSCVVAQLVAMQSLIVRAYNNSLWGVSSLDPFGAGRHMIERSVVDIIISAWGQVALHVASGHADEFKGLEKEKTVLRRLRREIENAAPLLECIGPDKQASFGAWYIDLVCRRGSEKVAIEGKFKLVSDGGVPDNRKAAFFDLYKLERYTSSGRYTHGLFLWLTDNASYLQEARGDSRDFSTHKSRIYEPGIILSAKRARDANLPLPLILSSRYVFNWQSASPDGRWSYIVIAVP